MWRPDQIFARQVGGDNCCIQERERRFACALHRPVATQSYLFRCRSLTGTYRQLAPKGSEKLGHDLSFYELVTCASYPLAAGLCDR